MKPSTTEVTAKERDQTILVICIGFLVLYGWSKNPIFLLFTLFVGVSGLTSQWLSYKIVYLWNKLAWVLNLIMPKIILSIIFLVILTPIAWVSKIFRSDILGIKNSANSTFKNVNNVFSKDNFQNPW